MTAVNAAFTSWGEMIQATLEERLKHLRSQSEQLLDQQNLSAIETIAVQLQSLKASDKDFSENLAKLGSLIAARKDSSQSGGGGSSQRNVAASRSAHEVY
jgi:hypothetical protein